MKQEELFGQWPPLPKAAPTPPAPRQPPPSALLLPPTPADNPPTPPDVLAHPPPTLPLANRWKTRTWATLSQPPPQESAPQRQVLSVSELTAQIKQALDSRLGRLWVKGELCNFKGPNARGHLYFSLKDEKASMDVKMWAPQAKNLPFRLEEGMALLAMGTVELYAPMGRYSLVALHLEPEGLGAQALAFQQLKARLAEEGLWGPNRKRPPRPLPFLPRRIGVVTSITGAALRDFLKVLLRRHPRLSVLVRDARVQGTHAALGMAQALRQLYETDVDVVVLARGGGSAEDLAAFNEEVLARAVFESPVPIVSAVGHEVDVSLCDLTADVRAATPSVAAELLSPVLSELALQLVLKRRRLKNAMQRFLALARAGLDKRARALEDPRRTWAACRLQLSALSDTLQHTLEKRLEAERETLRALSHRLSKHPPQLTLATQGGLLRSHKARLQAAWRKKMAAASTQLAGMRPTLHSHSPRLLLLKHKQKWGALGEGLRLHIQGALKNRRIHLNLLAQQLDALGPLAVLNRGYALLKDEATGRWLLSAEGVALGQRLEVYMSKGQRFRVRVEALSASPPLGPPSPSHEEKP